MSMHDSHADYRIFVIPGRVPIGQCRVRPRFSNSGNENTTVNERRRRMDTRLSDVCGEGSVMLTRDQWRTVIAALDGDESQRDDAFDALQLWAPPRWLEELDEEEETRIRSQDADPDVVR